MAISPEDTRQSRSLRESFRTVQPTKASSRAASENPIDNHETRKLDQFVADELLSGKNDVSILQIGRRVIASAATAIQKLTLQSEEKRKQADSDAHFRRLLESVREGSVGAYIGQRIFSNKTDAEIAHIVAEIETATGDSFENYARKVLGPENVPERQDGESDADYQRRVLEAVSDEIIELQGNEVRIKPEYANDPVAKIIQREEVFHRVKRKVREINADALRNGVTAQNTNAVTIEASKSFNEGDVLAAGLDHTQHKEAAKATQDGARDVQTNSDAFDSGSFFDEVEDSKLAKAAEASKAEFNEKSQAEAAPDTSAFANLDLDVKPS